MAHIYVVDDDEQLLRMVGLMLERGGHMATLVNNPIEALEAMTDEPPDMTIIDVMMPGMSGHDLCRSLRTHEKYEKFAGHDFDRPRAGRGSANRHAGWGR